MRYARNKDALAFKLSKHVLVLVCRSKENDQPEVRFIDFDSSGREGEALYPGFRNPRVPSPPGVASHLRMMCSHDAELLQACIEQAKDQPRPGPRRRRSSTALPALSDGGTAGVRIIMRPPAKGDQDTWKQRGVSAVASKQHQIGAGPLFHVHCNPHQA